MWLMCKSSPQPLPLHDEEQLPFPIWFAWAKHPSSMMLMDRLVIVWQKHGSSRCCNGCSSSQPGKPFAMPQRADAEENTQLFGLLLEEITGACPRCLPGYKGGKVCGRWLGILQSSNLSRWWAGMEVKRIFKRFFTQSKLHWTQQHISKQMHRGSCHTHHLKLCAISQLGLSNLCV